MNASTSRSRADRRPAGVARRVKDLGALALFPGTGIRRWLLLGAIGGLVFAAGVAYLVRIFSSVGMPDFLPGATEVILFFAVSAAAMIVAMWRLSAKISSAWAASLPDETLRESMVRLRVQARAPKIAAIGGGTGLSTLLRGLKDAGQLTGIVTVADDGGSSGRIRQELGLLPPGDIRNCIVALADAEPLMKDLFQYRFGAGSGLEGHSFGNLFIAAMSEVTGSFEDAVSESSRVLNVRGRIVPSTLDQVTIAARLRDGETVRGESSITGAGSTIERVQLDPPDPELYAGARDAIAEAQLVVIGPGSLYTSIMPNLLIPGLVDAINRNAAPVVYVCNVASQMGETYGFDVADHLEAILRHCPRLRIDYVLANSNMPALDPAESAHLIDASGFAIDGIKLVQADLISSQLRTHHSPDKLARAILDLYDGANGAHSGRVWRRNGRRSHEGRSNLAGSAAGR